eukprot:COSAG02_NODE_3859_length_6136_cov_7.707305_8_plen_190_part_00
MGGGPFGARPRGRMDVMDFWCLRPEDEELRVHFSVWKDSGYGGYAVGYVPGYGDLHSGHTVLAQDLATPGSAGPRYGLYPPHTGEDVETLDTVATCLLARRGVQGEVPLYASPCPRRLPRAQRASSLLQYELQLPRCLWVAPLFDTAAAVLWCPGKGLPVRPDRARALWLGLAALRAYGGAAASAVGES